MQNIRVQTADLEIRSTHDDDEFEGLRDEWTRLFKDAHCNEAFLTWEWLFAWWKFHKAEKKLWIVTARREGKLEGIAPFMLIKTKKYGLEFRELISLGHPDNDISGFIVREQNREVIGAICDHLIKQAGNWDLVRMYNLPTLGETAHILIERSRLKGCSVLENREIHYYLPIETDWDTFFEQIPHNLHGYLRHHVAKVKKTGTLKFEVYNGANLKWDHFLTIFEINKNGKFPHLYQPECESNFARNLFELTQGQDWVEIGLLYLNDVPVAFNYGFNMGGRHEGWRMAYDKAYGKHGIGKILSMHLLESLFKRGFREFDFLQGLEEYKKEWMPQERGFSELRFVPNRKLVSAAFYIWLPKLHAWIMSLRRGSGVEKPAEQ